MTKQNIIDFIENELKTRRLQYGISKHEVRRFAQYDAKSKGFSDSDAVRMADEATAHVQSALLKRYNIWKDLLLIVKKTIKTESSTPEERLLELQVTYEARHEMYGFLIAKGEMSLKDARTLTDPLIYLVNAFTTVSTINDLKPQPA